MKGECALPVPDAKGECALSAPSAAVPNKPRCNHAIAPGHTTQQPAGEKVASSFPHNPPPPRSQRLEKNLERAVDRTPQRKTDAAETGNVNGRPSEWDQNVVNSKSAVRNSPEDSRKNWRVARSGRFFRGSAAWPAAGSSRLGVVSSTLPCPCWPPSRARRRQPCRCRPTRPDAPTAPRKAQGRRDSHGSLPHTRKTTPA